MMPNEIVVLWFWQAEGDKQAAIARAEGQKQSEITRAEGSKQSAILAAEGAAQARLKAAEAEATAIAQISQAIGDPGQTANYLITSRYVDSLRDMTPDTKLEGYLYATETSNVLGTVGAIKEMLAATGEDDDKDSLPKPPNRRELNR